MKESDQTNAIVPRDKKTENKLLHAMQSALFQLKEFMKTKEFLDFAKSVHQDVKWAKLGDALDKHNHDLTNNNINLFEWYCKCQQTTGEIMINLSQSIAAHTTESVTLLPLIKQLSYILDTLVIASLNLGHFLAGTRPGEVAEIKEIARESWYQNFCHDYGITDKMQDIADHIGRIRIKHLKDSPELEGKKGVSAFATSVMVIGDLLILQSRFLTGLMAEGFRHVGNAGKQAVEESNLPKMMTWPMGLVLAIVKPLCTACSGAEAGILKHMEKLGPVIDEVKEKVHGAEPTVDHTRRP